MNTDNHFRDLTMLILGVAEIRIVSIDFQLETLELEAVKALDC